MKFQIKHSLVALGMSGALLGCSNQIDATRAQISSIESSPAVTVDTIPEFKNVEIARYEVGHLRNPFFSENLQNRIQSIGQVKVYVDQNRKRGPLEDFDIGELQMAGVLHKKGNISALIQTPQGDLVVVKTGDYLGQNNGRITRISKDSVEIMEAIPDGLNGYLGQPVSLSVTEQQAVKN